MIPLMTVALVAHTKHGDMATNVLGGVVVNPAAS